MISCSPTTCVLSFKEPTVNFGNQCISVGCAQNVLHRVQIVSDILRSAKCALCDNAFILTLISIIKQSLDSVYWILE